MDAKVYGRPGLVHTFQDERVEHPPQPGVERTPDRSQDCRIHNRRQPAIGQAIRYSRLILSRIPSIKRYFSLPSLLPISNPIEGFAAQRGPQEGLPVSDLELTRLKGGQVLREVCFEFVRIVAAESRRDSSKQLELPLER